MKHYKAKQAHYSIKFLNPLYEGPDSPVAQDSFDLTKQDAIKIIQETQIFKDVSYGLAGNTVMADGYKTKLAKVGFDEAHTIFRKEGLYIYMFVKEGKAYITCRGTQADASISANLDAVQPGFEILTRERENIVARILEHLGERRELYVIGHSLGGSVATIITTFLQDVDYLSTIHLALYQSAPVSEETKQVLDEIASRKMLTITDIRGEYDPIFYVRNAAISQVVRAQYARYIIPKGGHSTLPYASDENGVVLYPYSKLPGEWFTAPKGVSIYDEYYSEKAALIELNELVPARAREALQGAVGLVDNKIACSLVVIAGAVYAPVAAAASVVGNYAVFGNGGRVEEAAVCLAESLSSSSSSSRSASPESVAQMPLPAEALAEQVQADQQVAEFDAQANVTAETDSAFARISSWMRSGEK